MAAPITAARGERRSCDTDDEKRGAQALGLALDPRRFEARPTRRVRSIAWATCWIMASASWRCSSASRSWVTGKRKPTAPRQPRSTISGTNHQAAGGKRAGVAPGRLAMAADPVGGGEVIRLEMGGGRRGARRTHRAALSAPAAQDRHFTAQGSCHSFAPCLQHLFFADGSAEPVAQNLQRMRVLVGGAQSHHLGAQARGEVAADQSGDEIGRDRQHIGPVGDAQSQARLSEEEVVGEEAQDRGVDSHGQA